jgi:hypothetical protein
MHQYGLKYELLNFNVSIPYKMLAFLKLFMRHKEKFMNLCKPEFIMDQCI